jgi:hypothetical protein
VSVGAHVVVEDVWNDAGGSQMAIANISGIGAFSYAGSQMHLPGSPTYAIQLNNLQGTVALANLQTDSNINMTGTGTSGNVLGLGLVGVLGTFFNNTSSPAVTTEFLNGQTTFSPPSGQGSSQLAEQGCCNTSFLTTTLAQLRSSQPTVPSSLASGITDVRLYRVFVTNAINGIHLRN